MAAVVISMVLLWMMPTIVAALGCFVLFVVLPLRAQRKPKPPRPKAPKAPAPVRPKPALAKPKASPAYLRRWGFYKRHWVEAEKAQWDRDFNQLLG